MVKHKKKKEITGQGKEKEEIILKNKISYWSKHQELDKFGYNLNNVIFLSGFAFFTAWMTPFIIYFWTKGLIKTGIIYMLVLFIFWVILFIYRFRGNYHHNRSFRIREAMLRLWYKRIGVNTDKLDFIFEKIKKKYKEKMSNKEIENLAREVI